MAERRAAIARHTLNRELGRLVVRRYRDPKPNREDGDDKEWHVLADEAAQRFPTESAALLQAIESAAARRAYKKAAGFAKQLLAVDPINRTARRRMIDLQISHARKQMRSKRPDLAWKELVSAGEWERADAPNADLRINQALVGLRGDLDPQAEARLREEVNSGWRRPSRLVPRCAAGCDDDASAKSPRGADRQ